MKDTNPTTDELLAVLERTIEQAKKRGVSAAEAAISTGGGLSVSVRNGELESIEHHQDKVLTLSAYHGQRKGTATTTDFAAGSIEETVAAADRIARYAEADPYAGLIDPSYLAQVIPDLDLDHPWETEPDAAIVLATRCDHAARDFDPAVDH